MDPRRSPVGKILIGVAVVLALFGLYESVDATAALSGPPSGPLAELFDYPPWALTHFVPGALFMGLAPFQLWASFRNRHRTLHRWSGRLVIACSVLLGLSGIAFPFTMPQRPGAEQMFMTMFGIWFLFVTAQALAAARRRDFATHRQWMIRLFANGLTITTQRLLLPVFIATGGVASVEEFWRHFLGAAWLAWAIQIGVAEWWVRGRAGARRPAPPIRQPQGV